MATFAYMKWIDAHAHWAHEKLDQERDQWMEKAIKSGLQFSLQGGIGPEDWQRQKDFKKKFPSVVGLCFGLHPYWIHDHENSEIEVALDQLSKEIRQALALGETGLDLRPQYESSFDKQLKAFEDQLELANFAGKPVVLHIVQAFDEALRFFDVWGVPQKGGMIHSFNGSWHQAQEYLRRGLKLSVGGPLLRASNERLRQAVREIPSGDLLLETDLPDQPGDAWKGQLNPPESLLQVAGEVARLKKMDVDEVLLFNEQNFKTLFSIPI